MSSLASGILTIGPRFGGAISDAAKYFREALLKEWNLRNLLHT